MNFAYLDPKLGAVERLLSPERLSRYTAMARGDRVEALKLYERNTCLSEAFYTPLQGLEVCLRNAMSLELVARYGPTWYANAHRAFEHPLTEMIVTAERALAADKRDCTLGRIVAELNFGFWVTLISPRYDVPLWRPALRKAFPHRPKGTERKQVHKQLNAVRRLRNRVAHHEPVIHRDLSHDHELILRLVSWICPDTANRVGKQSQVPRILSAL